MKCYLNGENVVRKDIRDDHAEYTKNNTVKYSKNPHPKDVALG